MKIAMSSSGAKILFNLQRSFKPPAAKLQAKNKIFSLSS
jgi:hypothetical protein